MLRNLIRSISIRSLITISINLNRGQLLKGNRSINRLLSIINLDINRGRTISRLRGELSLTSTQFSLTVLRHQLRIQVVLLTRYQILISHSVGNNRTINNTRRTLSKLSLSLNRRLLPRWIRTVSVLTRQTRLIRRQDTLTFARRMHVYSPWANDSQECISWLLVNLYTWINRKLVVKILGNILLNTKSSELGKFFLSTRESLET